MLQGSDSSLYSVAVTDDGIVGYAPYAGPAPAQTYLLAEPLTGAAYTLLNFQASGDSGGWNYQQAQASSGPGRTYIVESPSGYLYQFGVIYGLLAMWPGVLLQPSIQYPVGGSHFVNFARYPVKVPAVVSSSGAVAAFKAERVRKIMSDGSQETNFHPTGAPGSLGSTHSLAQVQQFFRGMLEKYPVNGLPGVANSSLAAWEQFKLYSMARGQLVGANTIAGNGAFTLFYSGSSGNNDTYVDLDERWSPAFHSPGFYEFAINFRIYVAP